MKPAMISWLNVLLVICLIMWFSSAWSQIALEREDYEVQVEQGYLLGKLWTVDGKRVQVFKGVPFAEPPVGERRFKLCAEKMITPTCALQIFQQQISIKTNNLLQKPMKKQKWSQPELAARSTSRACLQFMDFHMNDRFSKQSMKEQGEDCLYLNIYAPHAESASQVFPVTVWIHGGSYLAGSGDTGIDEEVMIRNLVLKGIVFVTVNYRLGPLGFVSSDVADSKGNFGLWDQIEALRWVHANIRQFGGNDESVTVMGESAGASSVSILALSPVTRGLIHSAIIMSGSSAAGWAVQRSGKPGYNVRNIYEFLTCKKEFNRDDIAHVFRSANVSLDSPGTCNLMKQPLKCEANSENEMFKCLRKADFSDSFFRKGLTIELGVSKAVVDEEIIPYAMDELIGNASYIPIMTGVAAAEWRHKKAKYYGLDSYKAVDENFAKERISTVIQESLKPRLNIEPTNFTLQTLSEVAYLRYIREESSAAEWNRTSFLRKLQMLEADIEFVAPCQREVSAYANAEVPVYLYSFEHVPKSTFLEEDWTWVDLFGEKRYTKVKRLLRLDAPFHGLDHAYIFNRGYANNMDFQYDEDDEKMSKLLCNLITNFIKYRNPTPSEIDDTLWEPYTKTERRYARLKLPFTVQRGEFYQSQGTFWNEMIPNLAARLSTIDEERKAALTDDERVQLAAYRKAWWALWILVAAIAVVLWAIVICLVAQKCISAKSGPYKYLIVANR